MLERIRNTWYLYKGVFADWLDSRNLKPTIKMALTMVLAPLALGLVIIVVAQLVL